MRLTVRKLPMIRSPLSAKTTPQAGPALISSVLLQATLPSATWRAYTGANDCECEPSPPRVAKTRPFFTPATHVDQSPLAKGMYVCHSSPPVFRSIATTGELVPSGG